MATMPPIHPAADKFPMMSDAALRELAADIKQNGQRVPIQMLNGAILDGRNRWKACEIAKVAPVTQDWKGEGSPAGYVLSINLHRRHLTPEQHAAVAVEFEDLFREEAEARMKAGKSDPRAETNLGSGRQDDSQRALAQAAAAAGASLDSAKKLKAAAKVDREILDLAKQGQVNVTEARRLSEMSDDARKEAKAKIKSGAKARDVVPKPEPKKPPAGAPALTYPKSPRGSSRGEESQAAPDDGLPVVEIPPSAPAVEDKPAETGAQTMDRIKGEFRDEASAAAAALPAEEPDPWANDKDEDKRAEAAIEKIKQSISGFREQFPKYAARLAQFLAGQMRLATIDAKEQGL